MTDDEFRSLANEPTLSIWDELAEDHRMQDVPAFTALMTREVRATRENYTGRYTETMWIHGYPEIRIVVVTHPPIRLPGFALPGLIRTIPVGAKHIHSAETFRAYCEHLVTVYRNAGGWERQAHEVRGG